MKLAWNWSDVRVTLALSFVLGLADEVFIAHMAWRQIALARCIAVVATVTTVGYYRSVLGGVSWCFGATKDKWVRDWMAGACTFLVFHVPLYAVILLMSNASWHQTYVACRAMAPFAILVGKPYEIALNVLPRIAKRFFS